MTASSELAARPEHILYPIEHLEKAAAYLIAGAHITIRGLPESGQSTFVRQLTDAETRKSLDLGDGYLIVLLDGRRFAHLSLKQIRGAIVVALNRARNNLSAVCKEEEAQELSQKHLEDVLRSFKDYKPILILYNCSNLNCELEGGVCAQILRLPKEHSPTLVVAPNHLSIDNICNQVTGDLFVPVDFTLSPEQARELVIRALRQLDTRRDTVSELADEVVDWVGGNPSLLDCACHWIIEQSEHNKSTTLHQLSEEEGDLEKLRLAKDIAREENPGSEGWLAHPIFKRSLYEKCFSDVRPVFAGWWQILDEQEQVILLAMDELRRLSVQWQSPMQKLAAKGFLERRDDPYLIRPKMFGDYVSRLPTMRRGGPFRLDLKNIQTVFVESTPCRLSPEQTRIFFRLLLQKNQVVPSSDLFADLFAAYVNIDKVRVYEPTPLSVTSVDLELSKLHKVLLGSSGIERVPSDSDVQLEGYRLVVASEKGHGIVNILGSILRWRRNADGT